MGAFTLDGNATAIRSVSGGIKNAINNVMRADSAKQEAYLDAMGKTKAAEEARGLKMTNDHRENVDQMIQAEPDMPQYKKNQLIAWKLLGGQHMDNFSRAGEIEQRVAHRDAVLKDPSLATATAQAHAATSSKAPFDNIGNTGHSVNQVTGEQHMAHPGLAKLFHGSERALANQRNANAGESSARTARIKSGLDHTVTTQDENGKPMVTALPTGGGYQHIAPAKTTTSGVDATNAKAYNAIVTQVEKEMPNVKDDKFQAEVDRRWARRAFGNTNPQPSTTGKIKSTANEASGSAAQTMQDIPPGSKIIGTSGGLPVYLAPNGKKYIFTQ